MKSRLLVRLFCAGLALVVVAGIATWLCDRWTQRSAERYLYDDLAEIPAHDVAVVLGTSRMIAEGRPNRYFEYRMDAAAELYHAGKANHLLASGDNGTKGYDEPTDMMAALIEKGVPEKAITLDYAGFRTLDSMVRAREVFGKDRFIVVSQPFHNERAVAICRYHGIESVGYNARDVAGAGGLKTHLREYLARVKGVADLFVLKTRPKFLGDPVFVQSTRQE